MVSFPAPVRRSNLTTTSPSTGSRIEIRSAPTPNTSFDQTTPITATTLAAGDTTVPLTEAQPVQHILLWITTLGGGGDQNVTTIQHLRFERSGAGY